MTATSTQQTKHGPQKRGQLVAYADQRAYTDRLNEVFGEWGWTRSYDVQVAQNFERRAPGDKKQTAVAAKVVVVSKVTIHGLGSHTGVGEEWADDENAATRAEAQAFKRACCVLRPRTVSLRSRHGVGGSRPVQPSSSHAKPSGLGAAGLRTA